jgi:hypothetical protein
VFPTTFRGLLIAGALLAFAAPAHAAVSVLDNGTIRVAVDLQRGDVTWLSRSRGEYADNLLVVSEQSYYGGPFFADGSPTWHAYQDAATVTAHANNGKSIYDRALSPSCECAMETWATVHGDAVVVRNRLTSFRTDVTTYPAAWQELPALYAAGPSRLITYRGPAPYEHQPTVDDSQDAKFAFYTPPTYGFDATEHWAALVNKSGFGIGLVEPDMTNMIAISGRQGGLPSGYLAGVRQEVLDSNVVYDYRYTLVVGTVRQIRAYAYAHRPDPRPTYVFAHDREHFTEVNATDAGFPIDGALRVHLDQWDPRLVGPETIWPARRVPRLYIRGAWHTHQTEAQLFWSTLGGTVEEGDSRAFTIIPDGSFKTYRVDLFRSAEYAGLIDRIRLDPVGGLDPGAWVDITCISYKPCPVDRSAERRLETDGGRMPLTDTFGTLNQSLWSITGNSTGANASVEDGELLVSIAAGAEPLSGQNYIGAGVYSRCTVGGNFNVQVSYALRDWPGGDDIHLNFTVGSATLYRAADRIGFYDPPLGGGATPAGLPSTGTLRFLRSDGVVRGYYRDGDGGWIEVGAANTTNAPANVGLSLTDNGVANTFEAGAAFDNFRIIRGELTCQ